jgi:hypothetical protein
MFLHITTRIPGRKNDGMLTKVGGRGFPTFVAMSSTGEVMAKPRRRTIGAFEDAMAEAAELEGEIQPGKPGDKKADGARAAMELLRKVKMGALSNPAQDRADYLASRATLTKDQRKLVEEALILSELTIAQRDCTGAKHGSMAQQKAVLSMLAAKEKLGGTWPMIGITNRVLINLMDWAEYRKDPQMYQVLFGDFVKVRRKLFGNRKTNEAFIQKYKDRLDRLWKNAPPIGERRVIRKR